MKKIITLCAIAVVICLSSSVLAAPTWKQVDFDSLINGAVSYNANGDNVVVAGTAFYDTITSGGILGVQVVGGDGINQAVAGNFAMYGVFHYVDSANVLGWAMSNANAPLALEFRAWGVDVDLDLDGNFDGNVDLSENFTLNATDMPGVDYLTATFAELATWGYTEVAPGVWVDIAVDLDNPGYAALSVVIDGFETDNWPTINGILLSGALQGYTAGITPGSGIRVAAIVPVPGAILLGGIGVSLVGWLRRRRTL